MSHSLATLLCPRAIALVGATERSIWSNAAYRNLMNFGYPGKVYLVNRNGGSVYGQPAQVSASAIGEPVDLALLMVPVSGVLEALDDLHQAGIRNAVMLTSGFAEMGEAGARLQAALSERARAHGIALLGPNCLGFINYVDHTPVWTLAPRLQAHRGSLAVVSQSGATASLISNFAQQQGLALSYLVSTGNEADVDIAQVLDFLVDDPHTKVIALFIESVRDASAFARAAERALAIGKPVVVLKVGTSEITAKAAQAHTGALVGDDRVFEAACRRLGLIRVASIEDLVTTCDLLLQMGEVGEGGLGLVSLSGGICEIAADRASQVELPLATLSDASVALLREVLPDFGTPHNPLDVTGGAMLNPEILEKSIQGLGQEPQVAALVTVFDVPTDESNDGEFDRNALTHIGKAFGKISMPGLVISHSVRPVTEYSREIVRQAGIAYLGCGVDYGVAALARLFAWSARRRQGGVVDKAVAVVGVRPDSERSTLSYLAGQAVPVVPAELACSAAEAVAIAHRIGGAVALKVASKDIAHKTDIGGVLLNVMGEQAVAEAFQRISDNVLAARPDAKVEGLVVSPMRGKGVELFVGTLRDAQWGPVLAVGLGGIWVEALQDTSLRLLPVTPADVLEQLEELRGSKLLDGLRGAPAVDRQALAEIIARIG
ncbi:acetate--CoA ligase family protein, partial [Pseudomonas sp. CrR25]|nr:acetate--CoA ligase family protein [Pseudomonas sp. CrR25]